MEQSSFGHVYICAYKLPNIYFHIGCHNRLPLHRTIITIENIQMKVDILSRYGITQKVLVISAK